MKHALIFTLCGVLAACADTAPTASQADLNRYGIESIAPNPTLDASFAHILNDLRRKSGAAPVTFDPRLNAAAQDYADDLVARGFFSHVNPEGETERDRIQTAGYDPTNWGENLAGGQPTEADALVAWIKSPEHNRLLRAQTVDDFGLGVAGVGANRRWVLVMGRER